MIIIDSKKRSLYLLYNLNPEIKMNLPFDINTFDNGGVRPLICFIVFSFSFNYIYGIKIYRNYHIYSMVLNLIYVYVNLNISTYFIYLSIKIFLLTFKTLKLI